MDVQAANLLVTLKKPTTSSEVKLNALNALKSDIKHYRVPETAQATIFECIKVAITQSASSTLASSAFSTFGHLLKRLKIQDASGHAIVQLAPRLFSALQDRMGDTRETIRSSASTALTELYPYCAGDIEGIVRDEAMVGSNPRAKQTALLWVAKMHKDEGMPFKGYTQAMVARLEDADGTVRETAKNALIDLFANAPERAKVDLRKQMKNFSVRHSIEVQILAQLGAPTATSRPATAKTPDPEAEMSGSTRSLPSRDNAAHFAAAIESEAAKPPPQEEVQFDPLFVQSRHELEDTFQEMLPYFEGKETEGNWTPRDKSVLKLRRLTKGNAPSEFHREFMAGLKSTIEGILKVSTSLRTTMSTNGCQLVQELARTLGPALDAHAEMILQCFVKMSAATKHIAAENGRVTSDEIFQHCTLNTRTMQHIFFAAQEKNAQIRQCVPTWLKTVLRRQSSYKSHFESSGGLDLADKCIKKGLDDANPKVKEGMRAVYWTLAEHWPGKADGIMKSLDPKSRSALERDSNNPNASLHASTTAPPAVRAGAASRNNLREMMAEQRKAKAAGKLPERPSSAMAQPSPAKTRPAVSASKSHLSTASRPEARVASNASTASDRTPQGPPTASRKGSALMSGPVRRPRRPELARPQTADPYASRRGGLLRPETPADDTPSNSPPKGIANSKASAGLSSSAARNRAKTGGVAGASPAGSPIKRSPAALHSQQGSRPTSKGSGVGEELSSVREDDFTMVMPKAAESTTTKPGHKRPALGQTMSVDNGVVGLGEEDGFTMVMPSIQTQQSSRARSPLAYRSPLKQMFDEARARADASVSPKGNDRRGIDETMADQKAPTPRSGSPSKQTAEEVQIYEDPFLPDTAETPGDAEPRKVLAELPVNENMPNRMQSPTQSNGSSQSPADSPQQQPAPAVQPPQDRAEVLRNRKLLASGIDRIRAKTLDAHGFRRVQEIAKTTHLDIWEGGRQFDELMSVLLDYLKDFDSEPKLAQLAARKAEGLKQQALSLTRGLLAVHRKWAGPWHPRALVAVLVARGSAECSSHLLADLEKTADETVKAASPAAAIDSILDFLPTTPSPQSATSPRSVAMALHLLRQLLSAKTPTTKSSSDRTTDLGTDRKVRLVQCAARFLDDKDAEVRRADVELASDLFGLFGSSKEGFWREFRGTDEGRLGLLTYYIARREQQRGWGRGVEGL